MSARHVTLYHSPQSRSVGVLNLLEELGADYDLQVLSLADGDHKKADYQSINPMGKVPAIVHDGAVVTEQPAVYLYLADLYADVGLAPAVGDALRGPYLRWMVFYGSCFEPAVVDRALKRDAGAPSMSPYGSFDAVMAAVSQQLGDGPYMLGERFTAVDVLWGTALGWMTKFGIVEATPAIAAYIERVAARPAAVRARAKNEKLLNA